MGAVWRDQNHVLQVPECRGAGQHMSERTERENEYNDQFVARLELVWGEGFLSPGGAEEIRVLLQGRDIRGLGVLDIGCGTGGVDVLLVQEHGANRVVGVDIEQPLIERAVNRARQEGLSGSLEFRLVDPGPLPFEEASFDVAFSKDAIIQIPDKPALFADLFRLLRAGGMFIASDWLKAEGPGTGALQEFLEAIDFTSSLETPATSALLLESVGFVDVQVRDRTEWLREETRTDNEFVFGSLKVRAVELIGAEKYEAWTRMRRGLLLALELGELRPSHLMAQKPNRV